MSKGSKYPIENAEEAEADNEEIDELIEVLVKDRKELTLLEGVLVAVEQKFKMRAGVVGVLVGMLVGVPVGVEVPDNNGIGLRLGVSIVGEMARPELPDCTAELTDWPAGRRPAETERNETETGLISV